ncbi:aspartate kinase [Aureisphaera galaxeae]|uniref:aspartate kinase n=1 Tax=Aureisphaera galaxeae TaxID=1538023 RepID=UPI002350EDCD|nr:aspartate kinase [Aureisphaera galaxeae]MDC8004708.1 aspartate kinase [Aureisphaera galaxeae]
MIKVLKFGGSSVGSIKNLHTIRGLLKQTQGKKIVVCSAIKGVTDRLVVLAGHVKENQTVAAENSLDLLQKQHHAFIEDLIDSPATRKETKAHIDRLISEVRKFVLRDSSQINTSQILTLGEELLTVIFSKFLTASGVHNVLLKAKDFMYIDSLETPNIEKVTSKLRAELQHEEPTDIYITQGFVCRDKKGTLSNLQRGGSDYTATIIGAAVNADEVQIWTDINGLHNNDPRYVAETFSIPQISYGEAADLAFFGAKILHPKTMIPIKDRHIPLILKNTFDPTAEGTVISNKALKKGIKAIAAKDGITLLKVRINRNISLSQYVSSASEILSKHKATVDMFTISGDSVSLAIQNTSRLNEIIADLRKESSVTAYFDHSIICIVGEALSQDKNAEKITDIINELPVKMVSYENSDNIPFLVDTTHKITVLRYLNDQLFSSNLAIA